jgi:outer membrane protein TolC
MASSQRPIAHAGYASHVEQSELRSQVNTLTATVTAMQAQIALQFAQIQSLLNIRGGEAGGDGDGGMDEADRHQWWWWAGH